MKKLFALAMMFLLIFSLAACGGDDTLQRDPQNGQENDQPADNGLDDDENDEEALREFTLEELAQYDGREGRDAYVAVDGYVYDMTDSPMWNDGNHQGQVQAGQDLTDEIDSDSPHGRSVLDRMPKIGILVDEE